MDVFRAKSEDLVIDSVDSTKTLVTLLNENPHRRWILNIKQNAMDIDQQLGRVLKPFLAKQEILIQSEFDVVMRSTHDEMANTPYGSSQSDWLRFTSFQGMAPWSDGLLPAVPFKGDVLITPLFWKHTPLLNDRIVHELHRRQKSVIAGPLTTKVELEQAESLGGLDGFYITNPDLLPGFATRHKSNAAVAPAAK